MALDPDLLNEAKIAEGLKNHPNLTANSEIVHAPEVIKGDEKPSAALRRDIGGTLARLDQALRPFALGGERRWLVALGIAAGVAMEAKYAAPFFLAPLVVGLALGPSRRILWTREASAGVAAAAAIALPSVAWQVGHGLPFRELLHAASHGKNTVVPPGPFLVNQVLVMNPRAF